MAFRKGGKGTSRDAGDTRSSFPINQNAHGFTVPQAVYLDDADDTYKLAKADDIDTANAIGIVSSVENVNNFTIITAGVNNIFTGLTEGLTFYVSASTAGALTSTRPDIARPILNALSTTRAVIFVDAVGQAFASGNDTEVQYNKSGALAGDSSFTFDDTTKLLTVEDVIIENDLTVKGTTTSVNSETVNIADNHILLNAGNTVFSSESGGIVVNTGVIGSSTTVAGSFTPGVASTSNPSVLLSGGTFSLSEIVEISGTLHNDGIYEVLSFAANVLTVRGVGNTPTVEDFTNNQFQTESAIGEVVKVNATVLITNDDGERKWGEATGSTTSLSAPFLFDYFNEGNLPYVVGKAGGATAYQYNTIQSAIDAAEASMGVDRAIVVTPGTYIEDLDIASSSLAVTGLSGEFNSTIIDGDVTITANAPLIRSEVALENVQVTGTVATLGSLELNLRIDRSSIIGAVAGTLDLGNTNSDSSVSLNNSELTEASATTAINRSAGTPSVNLVNCVIEGHIDFSGINGGRLETENLILFDGNIDLSSSTITSQFITPVIRTIGTTPCLDLTSSGICLVVGGLLDVPGGGNAIAPATGASFEFANVATTSGTVLTTAMGTRLASDGVTLKSDGTGLDDFLNDNGDYSEPSNIYNSNGSVLSNRAIEIPVDRNLNILAFNNISHSISIREAQFVLKSDLVQLLCKVLDGAGNTVTFEGIELTASGMLVTDTTNTAGLKYAADYSGNFTARSLVDKGYVDASPTIFNSSGDITATRVIGAPLGRMLSFNAFDVNDFSDSNTEGFLQLEHDDARIGRLTLDGAGGITGSSTIIINTSGMTVVDTVASKGLEYAADYSANFTARSLVDKGYVDASTFYTADGTLTGNRNVTLLNSNSLDIKAFNAASIGAATAGGRWGADGGGAAVGFSQYSGGSMTTERAILFNNGGMLILDSTASTGIKYAADYSANFTARSLIDMAYSDANSLYKSDGVLSGNRTVKIANATKLKLEATNTASISTAIFASRVDITDEQVLIHAANMNGSGGVDSKREIDIKLTGDGIIVTDSIDSLGLVYAADYSENFVDRSLIDKGYSDSGFLARSASGAANLTSSGKPILAVTDSSADRTVTIATADIEEGRQFIVKDEDGQAGTNMITVTTPTISVTNVAAGTSGSDFLTSTVHGYAIGQVVIHAGFSQGTYNGKFTVTDIVSTTRYEVAAITFVATATGTSNIAIDGQASFTIDSNYGSLDFYCTDNQVFTRGASSTALAARNSTTGLLTGGEMSIVGGLPSNTLDISAATGQIVDHSAPASPVLTSVSIADDPTYTIANPTDGVFLIAIDTNSSIVEFDLSTLTKEERHGHVIIGAYVATSGGGGGAVRILDEPVNVGYGISTALADFLGDAIGPINMQGNTITGSVSDLSINTSAGTSYIVGQNYRVNPDCPNERSLPQATGFGFRRSFVDTGDVLGLESAGATFTEINPLMYNPTAGTVTAVANNNYTAQQVYLAPTGIYNVAYGQIQSSSESTIIDAVEDGTAFTEIAAFMDQVLIGVIVVQMTAGNLSSATFLQPEKFRMNVPA